jgi:hypothetical protein
MSMTVDGFVSDLDGSNKWMYGSDPESKAWAVETSWNASLHIIGQSQLRREGSARRDRHPAQRAAPARHRHARRKHIPTAILQTMVNLIDYRVSITEAVDAPRIPAQ